MKGIIKDALILFAITLVSGLLLGAVYDVTKEPIARQKENEIKEACMEVFSDAQSFIEYTQAIPEEYMKYDGGDITGVMVAQDASGNALGYVITVTSHEGYGGDITFMTGIRNDGTINGISITEISETPGLGMKAKDEKFKSQFENRKAEKFVYTKNGASLSDEIDAITSATITTNAMTNGMNGAVALFEALNNNGNGGIQ